MTYSPRHPAKTRLSIDEVATIARVGQLDVLAAIRSKKLRATQQQGEWGILAEDMRTWLGRK